MDHVSRSIRQRWLIREKVTPMKSWTPIVNQKMNSLMESGVFRNSVGVCLAENHRDPCSFVADQRYVDIPSDYIYLTRSCCALMQMIWAFSTRTSFIQC
ncbi:hypothetical protein TNIN_283811 [Trichonephila inaurata madagascariensis]|uniref:Uncharacterized protein n=1 Tax=Trichonephila inaurata madagascariensis TaxID=2747483 RepID=A0A8X6YUE4_9ARAC|nr:hypothetical protein TNIN_283811 [Trichonephila inaurata madagascariensis]